MAMFTARSMCFLRARGSSSFGGPSAARAVSRVSGTRFSFSTGPREGANRPLLIMECHVDRCDARRDAKRHPHDPGRGVVVLADNDLVTSLDSELIESDTCGDRAPRGIGRSI